MVCAGTQVSCMHYKRARTLHIHTDIDMIVHGRLHRVLKTYCDTGTILKRYLHTTIRQPLCKESLWLQYVRVCSQTDMDKMVVLLKHKWCLAAPKLLISVTGGAQSFNLNNRIKRAFQNGLVKTTQSIQGKCPAHYLSLSIG